MLSKRTHHTWALSTVGPTSVVLVTLVTLATYVGARLLHVGGAWGATQVPPEITAQNERRDLVILGVWVILIITLALLYLWLTRPGPVQLSAGAGAKFVNHPSSRQERMVVVTGIIAVSLTLAIALWNYDPLNLWDGTGWLGLVVGLLVAGAIVWSWFGPPDTGSIARIVLLGLSVVLVMSLALRLPGLFENFGDFAFTSEDLLAASIGRIPLSDYIPQYTVLLTFLVAPLVSALGHPLLIVMLTMSALQILIVAFAVLMAWRVGGRRFIAPAVPVALGVALATWTTVDQSATSYFATFPIRSFLPTLVMAVALFLYTTRRQINPQVRVSLIGVLTGLAVLNNLDFGVGIVLALALCVSIIEGVRPRGLLRLGLYAASCVFPFLIYGLIGTLISKPIDFQLDLVFIRVFTGWKGFLQPIEPFGIHIGIVALLASTTVTGFVLLVQGRELRHSYRFRQGLAMLMTGSWGLLGLPYFVGRSLSSTLLAASAVPVGLTVAILLPWIYMAVRANRQNRLSSWKKTSFRAVPASMGILLLALTTTPLTGAVYFWDRLGTTDMRTPFAVRTQTYIDILSQPDNRALAERLTVGTSLLLLPESAATELTVNWKSGMQSNSPENFRVDSTFADLQCQFLERGRADSVLLLRGSVDHLQTTQCRKILDFGTTRVISEEGNGLVEISIRR